MLIFAAKNTIIMTDGNTSPYDTAWLVVADETSFVFRVRACSDANVLLGMYIRNSYVKYAEVRIGMAANTQSAIFIEGVQVTQTTTVNMLDCSLSSYFWVSWNHGLLAFGTGSMPEVEVLLTATNPLPFEVEAVALDTGNRQQGVWGFGEVEGKWVT